MPLFKVTDTLPPKVKERPEGHVDAPVNPADIRDWDAMPDEGQLYQVACSTLSVAPRAGTRLEPLDRGTICTRKYFGPGADIQYLLDNGSIRPAVSADVDPGRHTEFDLNFRRVKSAPPPASAGQGDTEGAGKKAK